MAEKETFLQKQKPLVCLIVGGANLISKQIALKYVDEGARIILAGHPDELHTLEKVARRCSNLGSPSTDIHVLDLANVEDIDTMVHTVLSRQGYIDVVVLVGEAFPNKGFTGALREALPGVTPKDGQTGEVHLANEMVAHFKDRTSKGHKHYSTVVGVLDSSKHGSHTTLRDWIKNNATDVQLSNIRVLSINTAGVAVDESNVHKVVQAALLPFQDGNTPWEVAVKDMTSTTEDLEQLSMENDNIDDEETHQGKDPGPNENGTMRANPSEAVLLEPHEIVFGGIVEKTGERKQGGLLYRPSDPNEMARSKVDKSGAVMIETPPDNLEVDDSGHYYDNEPKDRDTRMLVQCYKPCNLETPHNILSKEWITPAKLHYVRNHLPVPERVDIKEHRIVIEGEGVPGIRKIELSLDDLKSKFKKVEMHATLECAGNRRNEMCGVYLVRGRAPWNHGAIGNSLWGGVWLRDVLSLAGLDPVSVLQTDEPQVQHVWFEGMDWHRSTEKHFEVSIPIEKAVDPFGDVMLAWEQNGEPLTMDHGYPVRVIVPGFVGTRSVKWLRRIVLSNHESQSGWQQRDYKQLPPKYKSHADADADDALSKLPPIMSMPTNSAILVPEAGTVIPRDTKAITVRGYAWAGGGIPIIRVDVSIDDGNTWEMADIVEHHNRPHGRSWTWVLWEIPLKVPPKYREKGGKMRICCKAWNRNYDTQPRTVEEVWNFRGLNCNSWHWADVKVG